MKRGKIDPGLGRVDVLVASAAITRHIPIVLKAAQYQRRGCLELALDGPGVSTGERIATASGPKIRACGASDRNHT